MAAWLLLSNSEKSPENTADGRRITYITPAETYIPMHGKEESGAYYSPIFAERDGKGPASLLRELLDTDLAGFKPYPKLATPEGQIAAKHGDLGDAEWLRDFVETGEFSMLVTRRSDGLYMVHQKHAKEFALNFQRSRGKRANDQSAGVSLQKLGCTKVGKSLKYWRRLCRFTLMAVPPRPPYASVFRLRSDQWLSRHFRPCRRAKSKRKVALSYLGCGLWLGCAATILNRTTCA